MFCHKCCKEINKTNEFCEFCGASVGIPKNSQELSTKQKMTINQLQNTMLFRFAKVIYIGAYALAVLLGILFLNGDWNIGLGFLVVTVILFTIIKKAFYYVVLGTIKPEK